MKKKLHYFPWCPADAEMDHKYASMTDEELGFYHRCLNRAWPNGLPADPGELERLISGKRSHEDFVRIWARVSKCFVPSEDNPEVLVNSRQLSDKEYVIGKSKKCRDSVNKRWNKDTNVSEIEHESDTNSIRNAYECDTTVCNANVIHRAFESDSDSLFEFPNTEKTSETHRHPSKALIPVDRELEEQIKGLQGIYEAGGVPFNRSDEVAVQLFLSKPAEVRREICEYVAWAFSNQWRTPAKTKRFGRLMEDGSGEHGAPQRKLAVIPEARAPTARELQADAVRRAAEYFVQQRDARDGA